MYGTLLRVKRYYLRLPFLAAFFFLATLRFGARFTAFFLAAGLRLATFFAFFLVAISLTSSQ